MADINTLVDDIKGLLDTGHLARRPAPEIGSVITSRLEEHLTPRTEKSLRMSNVGKPDRQLWYMMNYKGTTAPLSIDSKMKFLFGDIIEAMLIWLAEEAGHEVTDFQKELFVNGIKGHIDCKIDGVLVDVKSASSPSYKRFTKDQMVTDPFLSNYIIQLAGYCEAEDCDGAFLVIDKQMGHLKLIPWSKEELKQVKIKQLIDHKKDVIVGDIPERCYRPVVEDNGNEKLPVGCTYCNYMQECWKDSNDGMGVRTFKYSTGWKHYSKVVKAPRVDEFIRYSSSIGLT